MQAEEEFFVTYDLSSPCGAVNGLKLFKSLFGKLEPGPLDVLIARHPADGGLAALRAALHAIHNPSENAHVFTEAGPQELAFRVPAEPVHMEDARR